MTSHNSALWDIDIALWANCGCVIIILFYNII